MNNNIVCKRKNSTPMHFKFKKIETYEIKRVLYRKALSNNFDIIEKICTLYSYLQF